MDVVFMAFEQSWCNAKRVLMGNCVWMASILTRPRWPRVRQSVYHWILDGRWAKEGHFPLGKP